MTTPGDAAPEPQFWLATHRRFFPFRVLACDNAVVTLSNGTAVTHRIRIGATSATIETTATEPTQRATQHRDSLLSCHDYRRFWISWHGERGVTLGEGVAYDDPVISLKVESK